MRLLLLFALLLPLGVFADSLEETKAKAEAGDAEAQSSLSIICHEGFDGVEQDYAEAAKWCRKAAEQGDAPAQYNLGTMYGNGEGVPEDHVEAARWYRRSAEQG